MKLADALKNIAKNGCQIETVWPDGRYISPWTLARIEVIEERDGAVFVSLWDLGYYENPYGIHSLKVVHWSSDDWELEVEMVDDKGRWWRVFAIVAIQDIDAARQWRTWQSYAAENTTRLADIDEEVREEMRRRVETWPE